MAISKRIFPSEVIDDSVEQHFNEFNPRTRKLYLILLATLALFFLLMFIIRVDISVRSTGVVKSVQERTDIRSAIDGVIDSVFVSENAHVVAGQPLVKIKSSSVDLKNMSLGAQKKELELELEDLRNLLAGKADSLVSQVYSQQYALYRGKLSDAQVRYNLVSRNYNRYATLYRKKVISVAEYDKYNFEKRAVESEISLIREQQMSQWQGDYTRLQLQLEDLASRISIYGDEQDLHVLRAPVSGNVQQLKGIQPGSLIAANETVGEISPDSGLIAEAYVLPKDIGYLRNGTPVRMQIDAFDYNVWGMIIGKVTSISSDIFDEGKQQPYFKVRCRITDGGLKLKNGYQGTLKKGMTLQARFLVTRRSLFQLLYDKTDDWLNPNIVKNEPQNEG